MKAKQLYFILIVVIALLGAGLIGVAYEANNLLGTKAKTLAKLKADAVAADQTQAILTRNKADLAKYQQLNQIAETIVPQDKDQAEAVREIVNLASASGIGKLSSITFPTSTLGTIGVPSIAAANPNLTQLTPVKGIPGVYDLQITLTQAPTDEVAYANFINFLQRLEQNRRTAQVSTVSIQPDPKYPSLVAFSLTIDEFIKP